jgi:Spy/CpxP family protein refolding chaperone
MLKMWRKGVLALSMALSFPVIALAQGMMGSGNDNGSMMGGGNENMSASRSMMDPDNQGAMESKMMGYLGLTKEQTGKAMDIQIALEKEISPLKIQAMEKRKILFTLWGSSTLDEKAIIQTERDISVVENQKREKGVLAKIKFWKLLTPEQRNKMPGFSMMSGGFMMREKKMMPNQNIDTNRSETNN